MVYTPPWFETPEHKAERLRNAALDMRAAPMPNFPGFGTGEANHGSAPYEGSSKRAALRYLAGALAGLGGSALRPGAGFGQSLGLGFVASRNQFDRARQAAQDYAEKQAQQEIQRQNAETQRMLAEGAAKKPAQEPKPEKLVQIAGPDGAPVYVRESDAVGKAAYVKPEKPSKPSTESLVKVAGPNGETIYVPKSQAIGKSPPKPAVKPPTVAERRSSGALDRADALDRSATGFEKNLTSMKSQLELKLPYAIQPLLQKQYTNAKKAFTETVLREFSGAAISKDEYDKYDQIFFAQPGDDATTLEQKRQMRAGIMGQLRNMSGAAAMQEGRAGLALRVDKLRSELSGKGSPASGGLESFLR